MTSLQGHASNKITSLVQKKALLRVKGITLIELMVSVSISSIVSCIAIPNFNDFITQVRVDNEISALTRLLFITRNAAINNNSVVTLCPLDNSSKCGSDWQQPLSVFTDSNSNAIFEPLKGEHILKSKQPIKQGDKLHYGLGRTNIMFAPTGHLSGWGKNGTFRYCPQNAKEHNRAIRIATSGRLYQSTDVNHDGIDELRSGGKILCRD